jgi:hypothetical protein
MDKFNLTFTSSKALLVDILLIKKAIEPSGGVLIKKHETKHGRWLEIETNDMDKFYDSFYELHLSKCDYQMVMMQIKTKSLKDSRNKKI